ncbi:hypothetical protein OY671_008144, partial [Metschnikowia pulcherrima]
RTRNRARNLGDVTDSAAFKDDHMRPIGRLRTTDEGPVRKVRYLTWPHRQYQVRTDAHSFSTYPPHGCSGFGPRKRSGMRSAPCPGAMVSLPHKTTARAPIPENRARIFRRDVMKHRCKAKSRATRHVPARLAITSRAAASAMATPLRAHNDAMTPIPTPAQPGAIELGTGPLPGARNPETWHAQYGSRFARNVTIATLTPYSPDPAKASGTAVIVAPGGGFLTLSMENEGSDVAKALAARGIAAFVSKYRLNQTPATMAEFDKSMRAMFAGVARASQSPA